MNSPSWAALSPHPHTLDQRNPTKQTRVDIRNIWACFDRTTAQNKLYSPYLKPMPLRDPERYYWAVWRPVVNSYPPSWPLNSRSHGQCAKSGAACNNKHLWTEIIALTYEHPLPSLLFHTAQWISHLHIFWITPVGELNIKRRHITEISSICCLLNC